MALNDHATMLRQTALGAALKLHASILGDLMLQPGVAREQTITQAENEIRDTGEIFFAWLNGTTRITLTRGPVTNQAGAVTDTNINEENPVQIHDDEKFDLTVHTTDAKGFETADAIDWAVDDTSVVTLTVSADGRSCTVVAGSPGSAVITVTDNATTPPLSATEAVDVVPGGTATISLTEGPVSKQ